MKDLKMNQWALWALFLLAEEVAEARVFNVIKYGAIADGKTDISKALISAWSASCGSTQSNNTVRIPNGTYLFGPVILRHCMSPSIGLQIEGVLQAPPDVAVFKHDWIVFEYVKGLTVYGGGTVDGRGQQAWSNSSCAQNPFCNPFPINLKFNFVSNATVRNIISVNSKYFRISLFRCSDINVQSVNLSAPANSSNTDGIHISCSTGINITDATIGTGDDCISVGPGTENLNITKVVCGPGHGIIVGSLGKWIGEQEVNGVFVSNCTFINTRNGVRIKTWPSSPDFGVASNIVFEDITMESARNPVNLDQEYCPHSKCNKKLPSLIKISNTTFNKIRGTTPSQIAIFVACSSAVPCENMEIGDINLQYTGIGAVRAECTNVKPINHGKQMPPVHCNYTS